jgi:TRAP-type C4-dicarboxylate transport system permease small subunit
VQKTVLLLERIAMGISALVVVMMMLLTSYDAVGRYILGAPLPWAFQLTTYYLLVFAMYFALSSTFQHGDHISIHVFRHIIPTRLLRLSDSVWCLMSAAAFAAMAYGSWNAMVHAYTVTEFMPGNIMWPAWLSFLPIVIGSALIALRLIVHAYNLTFRGMSPQATHEEEVI